MSTTAGRSHRRSCGWIWAVRAGRCGLETCVAMTPPLTYNVSIRRKVHVQRKLCQEELMAPTTKPRIPLNEERVLAAAVVLADEGGIDALTMRKLADRLGVKAMSLYNHV